MNHFLFIGYLEILITIVVVAIVFLIVKYGKKLMDLIRNNNQSDEIALIMFANNLHLWGIISSVVIAVVGLGLVIYLIGYNPILSLLLFIVFFACAVLNYFFWFILKSFITVFAKISLTLSNILDRVDSIVDGTIK